MDHWQTLTFGESLWGGGLGETLPLQSVMELRGQDYWELGFLHNGFSSLVLKGGFFMLCIYIIWAVKISMNLGRREKFWFIATFFGAALTISAPFNIHFATLALFLGLLDKGVDREASKVRANS